MPSPDKPRCDDQLVVQYLLGSVSGEEAARLDELSIANDEFAERLRAVEDDLVDAYRERRAFRRVARSISVALSGLALPAREGQIRRIPACPMRSGAGSIPAERNGPRARWPFSPAWTFAAAACVMLLAGGYLLYDNSRLRDQVTRAQLDREALQQSHRDLQRQIQEQRMPAAEVPERQPPAQSPVSAMALVLLPQTRGSGPLAAIALPPAADQARFQLELESGDFDSYQAVLKDPATGRTVWRSGKLKAASRGDSKLVSVGLPAGLLRNAELRLDLFGIPQYGGRRIVEQLRFQGGADDSPTHGAADRGWQLPRQPWPCSPRRNPPA